MFSLFILTAAAASQPADPAFCDRLMDRFDQNERLMAGEWDLYLKLESMAEAEFERTGELFYKEQRIENTLKRAEAMSKGHENANRTLELMLAADCPLPNHEASPLTYSEIQDEEPAN